MIDRRSLIAGGALLAIGAAPSRDRAARAALDRAAAMPSAERLSLLRRIDTRGLSPGVRLDVAAALRGADLETRIAAAPPAARYPLQLRLHAGFDISPEIAHRRAELRAVELTRQTDRLLRTEGLTSGSVAERLRAFARDPRFLYSDDDAGRDRAVVEMNQWLAAARTRLALRFGRIPPGARAVSVVRMTGAEEAAQTPGYRSVAASDGRRAAAYHVDMHDIRRRPSWSLPSVVHHETLPGHMFQLPLQAAADPHPLRLKAAPGFFEGWAIYAEQLAAESGAYAKDRAAAIGCCQWLLFRLGRSLVDTGINHLGWSHDHGRDTLQQLQGDPAIFAPFDKDVARVTKDPASFAGQALNWLEITHIRQTRTAGGGATALRRFHDNLLFHGASPLALI